jgi:small redox-active disulfide protein 2
MNDVTQIRVGRYLVGIIGLKETLTAVEQESHGLDDEQIAQALVERLSKSNYIDRNTRDLYKQAFLREFKKFIGAPVEQERIEGVRIQVLGPGCPRCEKLEQEVMNVLAEAGIEAELEHVRDPAEIGRYGVMGSPALVINGEVKAVGSIPPKTKLRGWIEQAANQNKSR